MPSSSAIKSDAAASKGRPFALDPLFARVTGLPGIGPRTAKLFEKLCGGDKVIDLLWHKPVDFIDRRFAPKVIDAPAGKICTLTLHVQKHFPNERRSQPYKVWCTDDTGGINLVFFNPHKDFIQKQLPEGAQVIVSGKVDYYNGKPQITHPDAVGAMEDRALIAALEPVYPLTAGVTNKIIRKALHQALEKLPSLPEWLDPAWQRKNGWDDWKTCMKALHNPLNAEALEPASPARARLAYDELLAGQLALALVRLKTKKQQGRIFKGDGHLRTKVLDTLPFDLTGAQVRSLNEIYSDMESPLRMLRLLQGDVGSGKTVVAALAMLNAVECGAQAAMMAPTEILARQHAESLKPWLDAASVRFEVLTGRSKGREREEILARIASGETKIVIGTHALFQEDVQFQDLGLSVVDEQHRFGVHQRLMLAAKGKGSDVLVMTATPIPRTLTLTAYGDMDSSRLDEKPPGRKPIDTRLISIDHIDQMAEGIARQIKEGARAYWVCPLVEESEVLDLAAAQERYEILQAQFGGRVGLVHGKIKPQDKDAVMAKFAAGELDILVATTVIEVGVNVPEATIMVIEHAERFGLAQLHQLRGRVGRGGDKSYCFLLYSSPLGKTAKERLTTMRDTEDGFYIAETDLKLRGAGDILGTKQSGEMTFRLAELPAHNELLEAACDDARLIIDKDPDLESARGQALRTLLYLFERDQAIQNLRSG